MLINPFSIMGQVRFLVHTLLGKTKLNEICIHEKNGKVKKG